MTNWSCVRYRRDLAQDWALGRVIESKIWNLIMADTNLYAFICIYQCSKLEKLIFEKFIVQKST